MQLSFAPTLIRAFGANFKQSFSAAFTTLTVVGTGAAFAFNFVNTQDKLWSAFEPLKKAFEGTFLSIGLSNLGSKFYSWGSTIVGTKDAFKQWVSIYLNPSGLKAGAVKLYEKLVAWADIVYSWFRDKFWKFITNIPDMVRNWDKLRLSLFKWGTFLGGGGGVALFSMFASGENWGKLQDLMARGDFEEIMGDLGKLMERNSDAFEKMGQEELKEILEKFLNETEEAKEATKELLERQEERQKNKSEEEKEKEQLSEKEIQEEFKSSGGGSPQDPKAVFGNVVGAGLDKLVDFFNKGTRSGSIDGKSTYAVALEGMQEYIAKIEKGIEREKSRGQQGTPKQKFKEVIEKNKVAFMNNLAQVAEKAYYSLERRKTSKEKKISKEEMAKAFMTQFEYSFTKKASENEKGNFDIDHKLFVQGK